MILDGYIRNPQFSTRKHGSTPLNRENATQCVYKRHKTTTVTAGLKRTAWGTTLDDNVVLANLYHPGLLEGVLGSGSVLTPTNVIIWLKS